MEAGTILQSLRIVAFAREMRLLNLARHTALTGRHRTHRSWNAGEVGWGRKTLKGNDSPQDLTNAMVDGAIRWNSLFQTHAPKNLSETRVFEQTYKGRPVPSFNQKGVSKFKCFACACHRVVKLSRRRRGHRYVRRQDVSLCGTSHQLRVDRLSVGDLAQLANIIARAH